MEQFHTYARAEIFGDRAFDLVVPMDTRSMLILEGASDGDPRVCLRRRLDFISPDALKNKRIALVDDTCVLGRTLNDFATRVERNQADATKFAFVLYEREGLENERRVKDIEFCTRLDRTGYAQLLRPMADLTLSDRPAPPEHLMFDLEFSEANSGDGLVDIFRRYGSVVEQRRDPQYRTGSIHYPVCSPSLPPNAMNHGLNKIRFSVDLTGKRLRFSPEFFPALSISPTDPESPHSDPMWAEVAKLLHRSWHDPETQKLNIYESLTISLRLHLAKAFIALMECVDQLKVESVKLDSSRLAKYYGDGIPKEISQIATTVLASRSRSDCPQEPLPEASEASDASEASFDTFQISKLLLLRLQQEYRERNQSQPHQYEWEPAALSITELATKTGQTKLQTSMGVELLNGYGYIRPHFSTSDGVSQRVYHSTAAAMTKIPG